MISAAPRRWMTSGIAAACRLYRQSAGRRCFSGHCTYLYSFRCCYRPDGVIASLHAVDVPVESPDGARSAKLWVFPVSTTASVGTDASFGGSFRGL